MTFKLQPDQQFHAQEWPFQPGPRTVPIYVEQPEAGINPNTGLMLALHNWGGSYKQAHYLNWCKLFANRFNVVAIGVNYLQSGDAEPLVAGEKPYDFGYLQAIDCLRAIYHVGRQLDEAGVPFNRRRCYSMGGSGGGNVSLMVNKFAPHTFGCVVDICGMPALSDEFAYGLFDDQSLNAGYSRDPANPTYLAPHMREIRDPGHLGHLRLQYQANPRNKVVIVHGLDDEACTGLGKIDVFRNMASTGFRPDAHFLTQWHVDGEAVVNTEHSIGARGLITCRFADAYLLEEGHLADKQPRVTDIERGGQIEFPVDGGCYVVDYSAGPPAIGFVPA